MAKEAVAMERISAMSDSAFRSYDGLFAFAALRSHVSRITLVTILFQLVHRIVDEPFRTRDVIRADVAREAIRVEAHALD